MSNLPQIVADARPANGLSRRKRLAHAMGMSTQSVYRTVTSLAEAQGIHEAQALKHLEIQLLHGVDQ